VFIPSRPDGLILAADLSQLEWRVAALLSGDPVAIQEINDGADIHLDNAIKFFGDASFRQAAKIMTFRLLYGGTAYAFFMDTQMPDFSMKKWDSIVKAYGHKYCVLIAWQQQNIIDVPQQGGILYSPSGREYKIPMVEHKKHKGVMVYKDAVIKNYMIQGFATGDVVPLCMNAVWERMQLNISAYQSTNWFGQVHDSILFDTIGCEVRPLAHLCIQVFESIPKMLYDTWGIKSPIEFTGEVEVGPDYSNMTHSVSHEGDKWVTKGDWSVFV
jgi:DNA polymerase-1